MAIKRTQFGSGLKVKPKNYGPYKVIRIKGNDRYTVEKVGTHDEPFNTETSADNMIPWPQNGENISICMIKRMDNFWKRMTCRYKEPMRQKVIVIEGNIATGKTTLTNWIRNNYDFLIIPEPLDVWHNLNGFNLLAAYYNNQKEWAMTFQMYAISTLFKRHQHKTKQRLKIMERSLMSVKKCFIPLMYENKIINEPQRDVLLEWVKHLEKLDVSKIDGIIYLRSTPEISFQRMQQRSRPSENLVTLRYLSKLHKLYDDWLCRETDTKVFIINSNKKHQEIIDEFKSILNQF